MRRIRPLPRVRGNDQSMPGAVERSKDDEDDAADTEGGAEGDSACEALLQEDHRERKAHKRGRRGEDSRARGPGLGDAVDVHQAAEAGANEPGSGNAEEGATAHN